jgi:hypothetical protein
VCQDVAIHLAKVMTRRRPLLRSQQYTVGFHKIGELLDYLTKKNFRRVRKIAKGDYQLRYVCLSVPSSTRNNSTPTTRIYVKCNIWKLLENLEREIKFHENRTRIHEDQYIVLIISCSLLLRTRYFSEKVVEKNRNTHFMLNHVFRKSSRLWDIVEKYWRAR